MSRFKPFWRNDRHRLVKLDDAGRFELHNLATKEIVVIHLPSPQARRQLCRVLFDDAPKSEDFRVFVDEAGEIPPAVFDKLKLPRHPAMYTQQMGRSLRVPPVQSAQHKEPRCYDCGSDPAALCLSCRSEPMTNFAFDANKPLTVQVGGTNLPDSQEKESCT